MFGRDSQVIVDLAEDDWQWALSNLRDAGLPAAYKALTFRAVRDEDYSTQAERLSRHQYLRRRAG